MLHSLGGDCHSGAADAQDPCDLALGGMGGLADGPQDGELAGVEVLTGEKAEDTGLGEDMGFTVQVQEAEEFEAILQLYAQYPLRELILHPRVQKDLYRRPVRNQWYGFALERVKFPLCGNGDLNTPEDARALTETYPGLERLMFGRGLMADPALISRQKGGPPASRGDLQRFHDALYEHYIQDFGSPHSAMMRMKEHWSYLITRFRDHEKHAKHLKKAQNPQDFRRWAQAVFQELDLV